MSSDDDHRTLQHRTEQAFGRMDKRVKKLENCGVTRQQLEDLLALVPAVADLKARVMKIENTLVLAGRSRSELIETQNLIASELCFVRDRLLAIEAKVTSSSAASSDAFSDS